VALRVPAFRLGYGPHLLPGSFLPGKDNGCSGRRRRREADPIMAALTDVLRTVIAGGCPAPKMNCLVYPGWAGGLLGKLFESVINADDLDA